MGENRKMKVNDLKLHPKNAEIYGCHEDVSDLVKGIKRSGQVHTLTVNSDGVILAGHRRYKACVELGIDEVNVEIIDFDDPEQEIEYIIDDNTTREKTNEQKGREALALKKVISTLAKERKLNMLKQNQYSEVPNSAQRQDDIDQGKTRDIVASKLKYKSGQEVDRITKTIEIMDELDREGRHEDAELIRGVLNNRNTSSAEILAKNINHVEIPKEDREAVHSGFKSPNSYIKKGNKKQIETKADSQKNNKESMLIQIKQRYKDFLLVFQRDIEWLCDMEFYQNDDEITREAHSKLNSCLEKFKTINDMMQKIAIDEFGSITINK